MVPSIGQSLSYARLLPRRYRMTYATVLSPSKRKVFGTEAERFCMPTLNWFSLPTNSQEYRPPLTYRKQS